MPRELPPENGKYVVQDGEWVGSIAMKFGFADWKNDVWMQSQNDRLRNLRKDPHTLAIGDVLFIPQRQEHVESRPAGQRHTFKLKVPSEVLRIRLLDRERKPLKNQKYTLDVDVDPGGGVFQQTGTQTDGDGVLTEPLPSTAVAGVLRFPDLNLMFPLKLGFLTPIDLSDRAVAIGGAQQRLDLLGFDPGPIDGIEGPQTQAAVNRFQQFCKDNLDSGDSRIIDPGPVDGILGPETRDALMKFYGC